MREKLFKLFFPGKHKRMLFWMNHSEKLDNALQKKEAVIQVLQRKMRRMEREAKN